MPEVAPQLTPGGYQATALEEDQRHRPDEPLGLGAELPVLSTATQDAPARAMSPLAQSASRTPASPAATPKLPGITIQATQERKALRHRVNKFVNAVLVRHWNETMLRWDVPICPLVAGLPGEYGEFVFRRIYG